MNTEERAEYNRQYYLRHSKDMSEYTKNYHAQHRKEQNAKTLLYKKRHIIAGLGHRCNKRPYVDYCELCGIEIGEVKKNHHLNYHHWDDDDTMKGLWLCFRCHLLAESIDNRENMIPRYKQLKDKINLESQKMHIENPMMEL